MIPMTPLNDDFERIIRDEEVGEPEQDSPASEGGFGADAHDRTEAEQDLAEEGVLDEEEARETASK